MKVKMRGMTPIKMGTVFAVTLGLCAMAVLTGCGSPWAARVNGQKILESEIQSQLDELTRKSPSIFEGADGEGRRLDYRDQILNVLIDEAIVKQKAKELSIVVSAGKIDEQVASMRGDMTETMWAQALESAGYTEETLETMIETRLLTEKLIDEEQATKPVTDAEISSYYKHNKKQFLIAGTEDRYETLDEAKEKIRSMIEEQRRADVFDEMMQKWRDEAEIEIAQVSEETATEAE